MKKIPYLRDIQIAQTLDYPTDLGERGSRTGRAARGANVGRHPLARRRDDLEPVHHSDLLGRSRLWHQFQSPSPDPRGENDHNGRPGQYSRGFEARGTGALAQHRDTRSRLGRGYLRALQSGATGQHHGQYPRFRPRYGVTRDTSGDRRRWSLAASLHQGGFPRSGHPPGTTARRLSARA
jgi:hypothetical protein